MEQGWQAFLEVGRALFAIRRDRLYRGSYDTWDNYCRGRWDFSKTHADRLIGAFQVAGVLTPIGVKCERESQLRPLVPLVAQGLEKISAAWHRAASLAGEGQITAKHVRQAASEFLPAHEATVKSGQVKKPGVTPNGAICLIHLIDQAEAAAAVKDFEAVSAALSRLRESLGGR